MCARNVYLVILHTSRNICC